MQPKTVAMLGVLLVCGCGTVPTAKETAVVLAHAWFDDDRPVILPAGLTRVHAIRVTRDDEESQRGQQEWHRLTIYDADMKELARRSFSCHYGMDVDAVDLDGDGIPEFVMSLHLGPATGPSIRELKVLRFREDFLEEVVSVPQAGQAGPSQGWWYDVEYVTHDGLVTIHLQRNHDPLAGWDQFLPAIQEYWIALGRTGISIKSEVGPDKDHLANRRPAHADCPRL